MAFSIHQMRRYFFLAIVGTSVFCLCLIYLTIQRGPEIKHTNSSGSWSSVISQYQILRNQGSELFKIHVLSVAFGEEKHPLFNLTQFSSIYKMKAVNCADLFSGDVGAIKRAVEMNRNLTSNRKDTGKMERFLTHETTNCSHFLHSRGYITSPLSKEEAEFPIAFSILTYKDIVMLEKLIRAIYRPQNFYCIHVDGKTNDEFYRAVDSIARCLPGVFMSPERIKITWGTFSIVQAELTCMNALFKHSWKYFINLTGQEFPLQTMAFLVKILKTYDGANEALGSRKFARQASSRYRTQTLTLKLDITMGPTHIAASRPFVDYILHNATAHKFLQWLNGTSVPDEIVFSTLNNNPHLGIPGAYTDDYDAVNPPALPTVRYKRWSARARCTGKEVRGICIINTADLPSLVKRPEMFANKFFLHEDPIVVGCLEEKLFNDTLADTTELRYFNKPYYENLEFVKHHL